MNAFNILSALFLALAITGTHGCSGEVFSDAEDYRSVVTMRIDDAFYNFENIKTYQLCDEVLDLTERGETRVELLHTDSRDLAILSALRNQMTARGFTDVSNMVDPETGEIPEPDVILVAQIVAQAEWDYEGIVQLNGFNNQIIYYPGSSVDMSYDVESVIITMFAKNVSVAQHPEHYYALWTAGIHGTYVDLTVETLRRGIATAFAQSPYISAPAGVE
ncbi:MAG: DUF4136 domain-containing protein [Deltaproteobacteria bacterium]|nr:DUF4136 domain-containing protein [Deltaproteobacteria bacterium]